MNRFLTNSEILKLTIIILSVVCVFGLISDMVNAESTSNWAIPVAILGITGTAVFVYSTQFQQKITA